MKMKRNLALLLALVLFVSLSLTGMAEPDLAALEGSYIMDAYALGMPMSVYLVVNAQGGFTWTNKLEGGTDKGNGVIGAEGDTYLLLYSDSTPDSLKMVPFVVEGKTLVFQARVPYGSSGFAPNLENPDQPVYPTARMIAFEEALGTYSGGHTAQAMGSELDYNYDLVLDYGAAYTFTNRFVMAGETHEFAQQGLFDIQDGVIRLFNPEREGQEGQIRDDGITLNVFLSPMSKSLAEVSLKKATTAQQAGVYLAVKDMSMMGFVVSATLTLDAFGGYVYQALAGDEAEAAYEEAGSFGMDKPIDNTGCKGRRRAGRRRADRPRPHSQDACQHPGAHEDRTDLLQRECGGRLPGGGQGRSGSGLCLPADPEYRWHLCSAGQ